jgi:glycosyl transferase, family 25
MDALTLVGGLGTDRTEAPVDARPRSAPATAPNDRIPVYVINLAKDVDRWHRIETSLLTLGISPIRIKAVDGTSRNSLIRRLIKHNFATKDWALTPGEIGCALSHIGVWKKVARHGLAAVILEDDVEIPSSFERFYFKDLPLFLKRCDIVKFEGLFFDHTSRSGPVLHNGASTKLIVTFRPTLGTAGYALTRRGAEALLSRTAKIKVTLPIDYFVGRYDEHGAVFGETRPLIVRQASETFASNIHAERLIEGQKLRALLNSQCVFARLLRSFTLMRRGMRRSLAMLRIVVVARFFGPHDRAPMKQRRSHDLAIEPSGCSPRG